MVEPGDDISDLIASSLQSSAITLEENDILVVTQKVISKAEDRFVSLSKVTPSLQAKELAIEVEKDPRLIELILRESNEVVRKRPGSIIVEHKLGFVCASAGIDHSNLSNSTIDQDEKVLLLPENPDHSAMLIRSYFKQKTSRNIGVLVIDTQGRAWRFGVVGMTIGLSGVPALIDERGWTDLFGNKLEITVVGVADELAAAASLMMGQSNEGTPVVHVRGFPYKLEDGNFVDILRSKNGDLFR